MPTDKVLVTRNNLDLLANAIASKASVSVPMTLSQMVSAVNNISGGGVEDALIDGSLSGFYSNSRVLSIKDNCFLSTSTLTGVQFDLCETIGKSAFRSCYALSEVYFPACTTIDMYAFQNCSALNTLSFPFVESIGQYAFQSCLYSFPDIGSAFPQCRFIAFNAFTGNTISSVNFSVCENIISAFQGISTLTTVSLPECLSLSGAFSGCTNLSQVYLPKVKHIGGYTFISCALPSVIDNTLFPAAETIAFEGCSTITSVNMSTVLSITGTGFNACTNLEYVNLPNCTNAPNHSQFRNCTNLKSVYLPKVSKIGSYSTFTNCANLEYVDITSYNSTIYYWFAGFSKLKTVLCPNATNINQNAFNGAGIESIRLSVCSYVASSAFYSCRSLQMARFDSSCYFGQYAFFFCTNLTSLYLLGSTYCSTASNAFSAPICRQGEGTIYVRASMLTGYQSKAIFSAWSYNMVGLTDAEIEALG